MRFLFFVEFLVILNIFSSVFAESKKSYIQRTQRDYEKTVYPYFEKEKRIEEELSKKYPKDADMQFMWDVCRALETLDNSIQDYQKGLDYYTNRLSALAAGVESQQQDPGTRHWDFIKPKGGIDLKRGPTQLDFDVLIPAAIHTGLNDKHYLLMTTEIGIRHYDLNTVNHILQTNPSLQRHRSAFFALLVLSVFLEHNLNDYLQNPYAVNIQGIPKRTILRRSSISKKIWHETIEKVSNMNVLRGKTVNGKTISEFLNTIKELYLSYFIPIANLTNDRKHGIVRKPWVDKEEEKNRQKEAKRREKELKALLIKQEKESMPQNDFMIKEDDIIIGDKLEEAKVDFEITQNALGQTVFINDRAPNVYKRALLDNNHQQSIIVPFIKIPDVNNIPKGKDLIELKKEYLVITGSSLTEREAARLEKLYNSNKLYVLSTSKPERDGVFAYIPREVDGNNKTEFRMIAKPLRGNISHSIAFTDPDILKKIAITISDYFSSLGENEIKAPLPEKEEPPIKLVEDARQQVNDVKFDLVDVEGKPVLKGQLGTKNGLKFKLISESNSGYLVFYDKTIEPSQRTVMQINNFETFKLNGKSIKELCDDGFFEKIGDALFYVSVDPDASKIYALNDEAFLLGEQKDKRVEDLLKIHRDNMHKGR